MGKIYDLPTPKDGTRLTYLVLSDVHSLHSDAEATNKILFNFFAFVPIQQRRVVLLGDILDIGFIYSKDPTYQERFNAKDWDYFIDEAEKEKVWWEEFYLKLRKLVLKDEYIYFHEGNHEQRLRRPQFINKVPHSLRHNFDLGRLIEADERGIPFTEYNDYYRIQVGKESPLYLTHGMYCGLNPIKKHYDKAVGGKGSIIFGHTHEYGVMSFTSLGITHYGVNNPCLCGITPDTQPHYLEGRSHNWSQGATVVNVTADHFFINTILVKNGELILPTGELI